MPRIKFSAQGMFNGSWEMRRVHTFPRGPLPKAGYYKGMLYATDDIPRPASGWISCTS